jgi:hypothetical protein
MSTQFAVGVGQGVASSEDRGQAGSLSKHREPARNIPRSRRKDARREACVGNGTPPAPKLMFGPPFSPSLALGVPQFAATVRRSGPPDPCLPGPLVSEVRTVGHDEESLPLMGRADFGRAEYSSRNAVAQSFQCRDDGLELPVRIPRYVLAEDTIRPALVGDADDLGGEEARAGGAEALSGDAVLLAWISGSDAMNAAEERSSVEGGKVRPDKRRSQLSRFHARDQCAGCICFPLHVSDAARSGSGKLDAEFEPSGSGAEGESVVRFGT